jgi:hypothetical protein
MQRMKRSKAYKRYKEYKEYKENKEYKKYRKVQGKPYGTKDCNSKQGNKGNGYQPDTESGWQRAVQH